MTMKCFAFRSAVFFTSLCVVVCSNNFLLATIYFHSKHSLIIQMCRGHSNKNATRKNNFAFFRLQIIKQILTKLLLYDRAKWTNMKQHINIINIYAHIHKTNERTNERMNELKKRHYLMCIFSEKKENRAEKHNNNSNEKNEMVGIQ